MEIIPKSPQEMAAQILDASTYYGSSVLSEQESDRLSEQAKAIKSDLEDSKPYMLSDDELALKLSQATDVAIESGAWSLDRGEGAEERIKLAIDKMKSYGYSEEEATTEAMKSLQRGGFLDSIRYKRKELERNFQSPVSEYLDGHPIGEDDEKGEVDSLLERTIDIATVTPEEKDKLSHDFPSGNFLYHGAATQELIKIIDSGALMNAKALHEQEEKAAKEEGREKNIIRRNSGYEGVSWSMNEIDALPGDRYHLAGFVIAPEMALNSDEQLAVPSRPAPNEVLQISSSVGASEFYDAKTQYELFRNPGMFGESNSVFDNLVSISLWEKEEMHTFRDEPLLYQAKRGLLSSPDYQEKLRELYSLESDGSIRFNPDLLQQVDNEIPVAAVWLQAAIDSGRFNGTAFEGQEVPDIIGALDGENIKDLLSMAKKDWAPFEKIIDEGESAAGEVKIPIESMYFVAPRKDAGLWLKVIARSTHKPAGVLLYDDKKVRLDNFASSHRGNHLELSSELQSVIEPGGKKYIAYSEVLGTEFSDDMRTGHKHQVIAERHLGDRRSIKKIDGNLVLEDRQ